MANFQRRKGTIILFFLLFISLGFGTYKLTESPPTWVDEGMVAQLALNTERHGTIGLQISPNNFVSGAYISVGFPVVLPLAGVFKIFGEELLQARVFMFAWILLAVALAYFYLAKEFGTVEATFGGLLIATFAPLYGNGKNVLGEVPGLVLLFLFLLLLQRLEKQKFLVKGSVLFLSGLVLGLVIVTKPIFLLILGAVFIAFLWQYLASNTMPSAKNFLVASLGTVIPLIIWLGTQFYRSDPFWDIFAFYRNPYGIENVSSVMMENFLRFFSELSPLYTVLLFALWGTSIFVREWKKTDHSSVAEKTAFVFSLLVLFFYLRTPGWYRYFFPAQIVILVYLSNSLFFLVSYYFKANPQNVRRVVISFLLGLALFQAYQTGFSSWVADYYRSTRTAELTAYFRDWDSEKSIFVYNAPEVVIFLPRDTAYYQFLEINKGRTIGQVELERISREPYAHAIILSLDEAGQYPADLFPGYIVKDKANRYVVLEAGQ